MIWHSAADFFAMGGYGLYVWGSYGLTLVLMLGEPWLAARRTQRALLDAEQGAASADD
ncbi:MAG: heme exporter protein CcmD [Pseudomonadota bacterium]|nr:heme exporter protein CcmD [Pseudomonadota bacterium]